MFMSITSILTDYDVAYIAQLGLKKSIHTSLSIYKKEQNEKTASTTQQQPIWKHDNTRKIYQSIPK